MATFKLPDTQSGGSQNVEASSLQEAESKAQAAGTWSPAAGTYGADSLGGGGGGGTTSSVNGSSQNIEFFNQQAEALKNQAAATAAQIAYQYAHMNQVEIPGLQLQKDQLAFQQAQDAALQAYRQSDLNLRTIAEQHSNEIAQGQLDLAKLTQAQQNQLAIANLGLDTLKLVASLQADPFRQQQIINGLSAGGYSNAINALLGMQGAGPTGLLGSASDSASLAAVAARITANPAGLNAGDVTQAPAVQQSQPSAPAQQTTPALTPGAPTYFVGGDGRIHVGVPQGTGQPGWDPNTPGGGSGLLADLSWAKGTVVNDPTMLQQNRLAFQQPAAQQPAAQPVQQGVLFNPPSGADGANNPQPSSNPAAAATADQLQYQAALDALPNDPKQVVARNFLKQDPTTQQFELSGLSAKNGLSMDTNLAMIKQTLPNFQAPRGSLGTG